MYQNGCVSCSYSKEISAGDNAGALGFYLLLDLVHQLEASKGVHILVGMLLSYQDRSVIEQHWSIAPLKGYLHMLAQLLIKEHVKDSMLWGNFFSFNKKKVFIKRELPIFYRKIFLFRMQKGKILHPKNPPTSDPQL